MSSIRATLVALSIGFVALAGRLYDRITPGDAFASGEVSAFELLSPSAHHGTGHDHRGGQEVQSNRSDFWDDMDDNDDDLFGLPAPLVATYLDQNSIRIHLPELWGPSGASFLVLTTHRFRC